ncbi:MAG: peroxiredoxin [Woeseiaceae bacterium]|nr:peroxiredoxin [Woeseiaceae bacterium]|tara:strand:+ start:281 stop:769 length:489 start_codon:yes stop_codon:yes gene_type:complete
MTIKKNDKMPSGSFTVMVDGQPEALQSNDLFKNNTIALFAVPGAFTPGCSKKHLPGYVANINELKSKDIDKIACIAVNDIFVMDAWAKEYGVNNEIIMLADGNCDYTRKLGLENDSSAFGMGYRSKRYALIARNGIIETLLIDNPGDIELSTAESLLSSLES